MTIFSAFGFLMLLIAAALFGLWIWMLIDCLVRPVSSFPGNDGGISKIVWTIVLVTVPPVGVFAYFFIVHRPGLHQRSIGGKNQ